MRRTIRTLVCLVSLLGGLTVAQNPLKMTWSDKKHGLDGPWHAVNVDVGSQGQTISFYPGGTWETILLLNTVCNESSVAECPANEDMGGGIFDPQGSTTFNTSISFSSDLTKLGETHAIRVNSSVERALETIGTDGKTIESSDFLAVESGNLVYPGGKKVPLQLGVLSLGAPNMINQTFTEPEGVPDMNGTFITSYLWEHGYIPSYSYGMHIGSASLDIPPSLFLGGYDQSRIIGDVSSQISNGGFAIYLTDITLGVETGGYPWSVSKDITGLLGSGNATISHGTSVFIDPAEPYLYLPESTCKAIASNLPVTLDSDLGLYTWNTDSPQYTKIINSPAYLAFTFYKNNANSDDFTIKVPFALLNLTLEPPLTSSSTPYFPCMGTNSTYALGRSFLQAAFVGANYNQSYWFLAQAPGPDSPSIESVVKIANSDKNITGSGNNWAGTWANTWKPIATTDDSDTSGLSTGAKAGVGIGCAVAGSVLVGVLAWFFLRRRRDYGKAGSQDSATTDIPFQHTAPMAPVEAPGGSRDNRHELDYNRNLGWQGSLTQPAEGYGPSRGQGSSQSAQISSEGSQGWQNRVHELAGHN